MPFPFLPLGAALAIGVLGGAFALFWLALRALDRAAASARDAVSGRVAVAPGLVAGLRTWGRDAGGEDARAGGDEVPDGPAGPDGAADDDSGRGAHDAIDDGVDAGDGGGTWGAAESEDLPAAGAVSTEAVRRA